MNDDLFSDDQFPSPDFTPPAVPDAPAAPSVPRPLADRMRPRRFEDFLGQQTLAAEGAALRRLIAQDRVPSMILWGPPGSGKTTLAHLIARETKADFLTLSAVESGVKDLRRVIDTAKTNRQYARRTVLFLDEIHRFNKAQQDALLPHVESGLLTLIGATTENPSFSVIAPLLSRCRVFTLQALGREDLMALLRRAVEELNQDEGAAPLSLEDNAFTAIASLSDGDARRALGMLEVAADLVRTGSGDQPVTVSEAHVRSVAQRHLIYDREGEEHFNVISALHKVIRSSDPHAAAYWAQRMLDAGEDPRYLLRRLTRITTEDIGLADPHAVQHAVACQTAYERLGSPEGDLFVIQLAVYLAVAPKSHALYAAHKAVKAVIAETGTLPVPLPIRNAPTGLMKELGYGAEYTYDHDAEDAFIAKQGLPDALVGQRFYEPTTRGEEAAIRDRLARWDAAREAAEHGKGKANE